MDDSTERCFEAQVSGDTVDAPENSQSWEGLTCSLRVVHGPSLHCYTNKKKNKKKSARGRGQERVFILPVLEFVDMASKFASYKT